MGGDCWRLQKRSGSCSVILTPSMKLNENSAALMEPVKRRARASKIEGAVVVATVCR